MVNEMPVTNDILQITHKAYLKEYDGINGFLAAIAIVLFGEFIEKLKVYCAFQSSVEAVFWNTFGQIKGVEQLGLVVLFSLQEFLLRYKKSRTFAWVIFPFLELCNSYHCYAA
jgi:hypothetical protein